MDTTVKTMQFAPYNVEALQRRITRDRCSRCAFSTGVTAGNVFARCAGPIISEGGSLTAMIALEDRSGAGAVELPNKHRRLCLDP